MSVLEAIQENVAKASREALRQYHKIVGSVAADAEPSVADVQAALDATGKTPAELTADVRKLRQRLADRATVEAADKAAAERGKIQEAIAAANSELERARKAHAATVRPLQTQLHEIDHLAMLAAAARHRLTQTCDDPDLLAREQANRERLEQAGSTLKDIRRRLDYARADLRLAIRDLEASSGNMRHPGVVELQQTVEGHRERVAELEQELADAAGAEAEAMAENRLIFEAKTR